MASLFFVVRTRGTTGRSGSDTGGTSLVLEQKTWSGFEA